MNWPLFWALALAFGVVIGNIMLLKHTANIKLPPLSANAERAGKQQPATPKVNTVSPSRRRYGQTPNSR